MITDRQIDQAVALVQSRLRAYQKEKKILSQTELAQDLGLPRGTLKHYLNKRGASLPSPTALSAIRKTVRFTDKEAREIETAYSRRASLSRSRAQPGHGKSARPGQSTAQPREQIRLHTPPTLESLSSRFDALEAEVKRLRQRVMRDGVPSSDYAQLLAGESAGRYSFGDTPYILTAESFQPIDTSQWSNEELQHFVGYANHVLTVCRKCMLLLAQFKPEEIRHELLDQLHTNLRLLWDTFKVASSAVPEELAEIIQMEKHLSPS